MKIVADSLIPHVTEYFGAYGELILERGRTITANDVKDADILLVRSVTPVGEALLKNSKVKFVGSVTSGTDHLDTKWLEQSKIAWSCAGGFNAPPVADYVITVIAALQHKQLLKGKHLRAAVIGVGNVGRLVAKQLQSLGFEVTLCDPIRAQQEKDFTSTPLSELKGFDLITLHVPLTKTGEHATYHFINEAFLKRQKAGCVLLNASRGAVIDSESLLNHGRHLNWCLDVWENEPTIDKAVLEHAVIATPHIAGYSVQSKIRGIDMIYRIACEKKIIKPQAITPFEIPSQTLAFKGKDLRWHDIILEAFDLFIITDMMRTLLLPVAEYAHLFDELRQQFNYRYEFAYTKVICESIGSEDKTLLNALHLQTLPQGSHYQ